MARLERGGREFEPLCPDKLKGNRVSDNTAHELANLFGIMIFGSVALFVCGLILLGLIALGLNVFVGSPPDTEENDEPTYAK